MRDYDPTTGRYIEADPLGLVDGASVYGYALGNPGRFVDPRGEFGVVGAAIGAGSNLGLQTLANYLRYGSLSTALKCVDIKDVVISGGIGALGGSLVKAYKFKGSLGAFGFLSVSTYTKRIAAPVPIRIGDECECNGGDGLTGWKKKFVDFVEALSPQL